MQTAEVVLSVLRERGRKGQRAHHDWIHANPVAYAA